MCHKTYRSADLEARGNGFGCHQSSLGVDVSDFLFTVTNS